MPGIAPQEKISGLQNTVKGQDKKGWWMVKILPCRSETGAEGPHLTGIMKIPLARKMSW